MTLSIPAARAVIAAFPSEGIVGIYTDIEEQCEDENPFDCNDGEFVQAIARGLAAAREGWPAALDEVERLRAELRHERRSLDAVREEMAADVAEVATLRAALVEACDEIHGWAANGDAHPMVCQASLDIEARLRALAAEGAE